MVAEPDDTFAVSITRDATAVVITVSGELDGDTAPDLDEHLDQADLDAGVVVMDMTGVTFCGSAGLACLLATINRGVDLHVVGSRPVIKAITLTRVDRCLKLVPSVAAAIGAAGHEG